MTSDAGVNPGAAFGPYWNVGGDLIVGDTIDGSLSIQAGGTVNNEHAVIGNDPAVNGTALVSDDASTWTNTGVLYIGGEGNGTLTIQDGGEVISTQNSNGTWGNTTGAGFIGLADGSTGTVTVSGIGTDGIGSNWSNTNGDLVIGQAGNGTLTIKDGGTVDNEHGWIGAESTSAGMVEVSGEGSTWTSRAALFIGEDGNGTLTVQDGGTVSSGSGTTYIGHHAGTGAVTVSGINSNGTTSSWTNDGNVVVGGAGTGTLTIDDGGAVNTANGYIGDTGGGVGTVTVSGVNANGTASIWTSTGDLYIGNSGTGTLNILAGGKVSNTYGVLGSNTGGDGHVLMSGLGSLWENSGTLRVGAVAAGYLRVEDQATVTSAGATIGDGAQGDAVITGAGTTWVNSGALTVGNSGAGSLTIDDGARVQVDGVVWVGSGSGAGTLTIKGAAANRGILETSQILRGVGTGSVTIDGGILRATQDNLSFFYGFGSQHIAVGANGATIDTNGHDIGIAPILSGAGALIKDGAGALVLTGENTYGGGTSINAGTLQLGDGGSSGSILGNVANGGILAFNRSDVVTFGGTISGIGGAHQIGTGKTILTANSSALLGVSQVQAGILSIDGILGGTMEVWGGRLQGYGQVGDTTNFAGGTIAPGNSIGTLTIAGKYFGSGGTLEIETVLGDDSSATDKLIVTGDTSGTTNIHVINFSGGGGQTTEGIKIIDVGGASNGAFTLLGNYTFQGDPVVVGGAYAYRLYQGGVTTPADGDWYLRSALPDPADPAAPASPLYQAGAPVYETYAAVLQGFNGLDTLQQRVGNRAWTNGVVDTGALPEAAGANSGIWGRIVGRHASIDPKSSTTGANYGSGTWQLQAGADGQLYTQDAGKLIGGLSLRYGTIAADVSSIFGNGSISSTGFGMGGSLTWYGNSGFFLDAQANLTWYGSDLASSTAGISLISDNRGFGYALGVEAGKQIALGPNWSVTPQAQLSYSAVDYDDFTDALGAAVSLADADSLKIRLGISADYQNSWTDEVGETSRLHAYGIAYLYYDILPETATDLARVRLTSEQEALWGGLGIGGTYNWGNDKYALHGEAKVDTSLANFGESYEVTGTAGFRVRF